MCIDFDYIRAAALIRGGLIHSFSSKSDAYWRKALNRLNTIGLLLNLYCVYVCVCQFFHTFPYVASAVHSLLKYGTGNGERETGNRRCESGDGKCETSTGNGVMKIGC